MDHDYKSVSTEYTRVYVGYDPDCEGSVSMGVRLVWESVLECVTLYEPHSGHYVALSDELVPVK